MKNGFSAKARSATAFLLFTGCTFFQFNPVTAQTKYIAGNYQVEYYEKKEGLPESIVIDITQDRKGYMWMTTPYSLVRFDGYEFKIFSTRDQFPDLYVHFNVGLLEDSRGILWMSTMNMGLFSFDPQTRKFSRYYKGNHPLSICDDHAQTIAEDSKGNIWVGTQNGLNYFSFAEGSIKVKQFVGQSLSGNLLQNFNSIIHQKQPLVSLIHVTDLETRQAYFNVGKTSKYLITSLGEVGDGDMADFGWIENDKGEIIWKHTLSKSLAAGGAGKNKLELDILQLTPGRYKVFYKTDENHSWNRWNDNPPDWPELWGIQLFQLSPAVTDTMDVLIKNAMSKRLLQDDFIKMLIKGSDNSMWALTGAGLEKLNFPVSTNNKFTSEKMELLPGFYPGNSLAEAGKGKLMIPGYYYDSVSKKTNPAWLQYDYREKTSRLISKNIFYSFTTSKGFLKDRNETFWMGTFDEEGHGIYIAEKGNESSTFRKLDVSPPEYFQPGKPTFEQIWSIYEDRSGYIWIGSRGYGLYKIKLEKSPLTFLSLAGDTQKDLKLTSIAEDGNGNIWLNSTGRWLVKYDIESKRVNTYNPKNSIKDIFFRSGQKDFIVSGKKQIIKYDPSQSNFKKIPIIIPDSLRVINADRNDNLWAINKTTTDFHKAYYIYDGKKFLPVAFDSSGIQGFYRKLHFGNNGNIWLAPGFEGVHLYKIDTITGKVNLVKKYLPEGYDVYDVYEDETGSVWLGTYDNGLLRLNPLTGKFTPFTKGEGMPSNFIYKIVPAGKKLWIITDLGTAFFDKEKGVISINRKLDEFILQYIPASPWSSLRDRDYHSRVLASRSGKIAFLTKNGFCLFDPDSITKDTLKPELHITGLLVDKHLMSLQEKPDLVLKFNHNQNNIEIAYIGLHYDQPSLNLYSYQLKGANADWVSAGTEKVARYSNLSPGNYEFYLKSANADGVWSDAKKMFSFIIRPPWWQTWWAYTLYVLMLSTAVWLFIKYRSRYLKKENILLETKVAHRTAQLNQSLENLKVTQSQLIQSEKMASLGELTAGIAHEIQNPLNFVNNFSEVNNELIEELKMKNEKFKSENSDEQKLLNDIFQNNEKIAQHGKRADAIVKGMLQHSRVSTGQKEPTDINALADEYLRLAYHGFRAKDKSFNATIQTDFDNSIGKINSVPQDIGRVLLNLYNNAFYAVIEKKNASTGSAGQQYEPTVSVSTKKLDNKIEIKVSDNGNGIPQNIVDKIFQPFFTTKPTGQGTGLGLSLSYDIIKAHGGEIIVNTKEGERSEFIISLPAINLYK